MTTIAAVDIGIARVKVLVGHTNRWGTKIESWRCIDYIHPARQASAFDPDGADHYRQGHDALVDVLCDLRSELPSRVQWRIGFSSLYARLYPMRLHAAKCKRLRIAAQIYRDKLSVEQWDADYRILSYDRRMGEGEVLLWAWRQKPLNDLLDILEDAAIAPSVVEFDALCLAGALECLDSTEPLRLLIDLGFSKTLLLLMRGDTLLQCRVVPRGVASVCERLGQRLNLPLCEVETRLAEPSNEWSAWTELTVQELFEPFLLQLHREIEFTCDGQEPGEIYVCGGLSGHAGFFSLLQDGLSPRLSLFNPLPADESVPAELHSAFCTAYGLLTR
ncbi:MAG: hypothetical protein K8R90_06365 [Candidatus Cloacimonetes bacterium]|nr:hypothetical protein [Candidatus Cloacimonadota bacterium]